MAETVGAMIIGDHQALNEISDLAAAGELGGPAELGDWLGEATYDALNAPEVSLFAGLPENLRPE